MLIKIREKSGGWVVKSLLGLLAVAFALFFGFGDFARISGRQPTSVAVVGGTEISVNRLEREYRLQLRAVANRLGIDTQEARRLGLAETVLQQLIGEALFDRAAADRGIGIGDALVRDSIRGRAAFQTDGAFDPALYQLALGNRGIGIAAVIVSESEANPVPLAETTETLGRFLAPVPVLAVKRAGGDADRCKVPEIVAALKVLPAP